MTKQLPVITWRERLGLEWLPNPDRKRTQRTCLYNVMQTCNMGKCKHVKCPLKARSGREQTPQTPARLEYVTTWRDIFTYYAVNIG